MVEPVAMFPEAVGSADGVPALRAAFVHIYGFLVDGREGFSVPRFDRASSQNDKECYKTNPYNKPNYLFALPFVRRSRRFLGFGPYLCAHFFASLGLFFHIHRRCFSLLKGTVLRPFAVLFHRSLVARFVHLQSILSTDVFCNLERQAVGRPQIKSPLAGEDYFCISSHIPSSTRARSSYPSTAFSETVILICRALTSLACAF